MQIKITLANIKQMAKNHKQENPNIKHSEALNAIAQKYGFEKYEILKAKTEANNGSIEIDIPILAGAGMSFANMESNQEIFYLRDQGVAVPVSSLEAVEPMHDKKDKGVLIQMVKLDDYENATKEDMLKILDNTNLKIFLSVPSIENPEDLYNTVEMAASSSFLKISEQKTPEMTTNIDKPDVTLKCAAIFNGLQETDIPNGIIVDPELFAKIDTKSQALIIEELRNKAKDNDVKLLVSHPDGSLTEVPKGAVAMSSDGYNFSIVRPSRDGMSYYVENELYKALNNGYSITVIEPKTK